MLNVSALQAAMPLTDQLDANGFFLMSVAGSPLDKLVTATRSSKEFVRQTESGVEPDLFEISYIANAKGTGLNFSDHDLTMDNLVDVCAAAVQGHINFARTVVSPLAIELAENVSLALNDSNNVSQMLGYEVLAWNPSPLLTNDAFEKEVRPFETIPYADPAGAFRLGAKSFPDIVKAMETGKSSVDGDMALWAASKGENFFLNLWSILFQSEGTFNGKTAPSVHDLMKDYDHGSDYAIAIYLLARRLIDDPPEDTGMSLSAWNNLMADFRDQSALKVCAAINTLKRDLDSGRLVMSTVGNKVTVNGVVYKQWINANGENEVLFGNMLKQPSLTTVTAINESAEVLKAAWKKFENLTLMTENMNRHNRAISALRREFRKQLMESAGGDERITNMDTVNGLFEEELSRVTPDDMSNLYQLCLRLVCRSRFYKSAAERLLGSMDRIQKTNPKATQREAAAMATIEYVAYWVATQLKAVKC